MRNIFKILCVAFLVLNFSGCATTKKVLPLHDEVLIYQLPYDLTYLRTLDALNLQDGWLIDGTEKEKGIINIRNTQFTHLNDADNRTLTFLVKRVDREHTSVSLAPESQRTLSGGDLLKAIGKQLSSELK